MADLVGILSLSLLGLGAQVFLTNPIRYMNPNLPILLESDWPSGRVMADVRRNLSSYGEQEFWFNMANGPLGYSIRQGGSMLRQRAIIFSSPVEAAKAWEQGNLSYHHSRIFNDGVDTTPANFNGEKIPFESALSTSNLECKTWPDGTRSCVFWGYSDRWYSDLWLASTGEEYLSAAEINRLVARVIELLLEAR